MGNPHTSTEAELEFAPNSVSMRSSDTNPLRCGQNSNSGTRTCSGHRPAEPGFSGALRTLQVGQLGRRHPRGNLGVEQSGYILQDDHLDARQAGQGIGKASRTLSTSEGYTALRIVLQSRHVAVGRPRDPISDGAVRT